MTTPQGGKQAVILSGGGAHGAYEVGVMKALFAGLSPATNHRPLNPDILVGTSVGSYNAAFLVAQWETYGPAAIANLEQVWLDKMGSSTQKCGHGAFRILASPLEFITPACFIPNPLRPFIQLAADSALLAWDGLQRAVNVAIEQDVPLLQRVTELFNFASFVSPQPMAQTLRETIRFADIRRAEKVLRIAATNWETGQLRTYSNQDMTDQLGPLVIMASAAIPGFFPPVEIGSQSFVDGGVLMNTPLPLAIAAGADTLHVIYLDPRIENIPLAGLEHTLETMYRMQTIGWAKALNNDIAAAKHVNREVAYAQLIAETLGILQQRSPDENLFEGLPVNDIQQYLQQSLKYRELTIHLYHPHDDLGGALGVLNFDGERIRHLIERGFNDAIDYSRNSGAYEIVQPFHLPTLSSQPASGE
ncbi:MAG: patatin-like phospholipase family protein [Candidatus Entotheonellia bacterium]